MCSWRDEHGHLVPTHPCLRCGAPVPDHRVDLTHLRMVGWQPYIPASTVNWCGHAQEVVPIPDRDGRCWLVPVLGEAR